MRVGHAHRRAPVNDHRREGRRRRAAGGDVDGGRLHHAAVDLEVDLDVARRLGAAVADAGGDRDALLVLRRARAAARAGVTARLACAGGSTATGVNTAAGRQAERLVALPAAALEVARRG